MAYSSITKPSDYFNTKLYTGNGSTQNITGVGFQPDWTWIKNRDRTDYHILVDAVRGAPKEMYSNLSNAEYSNSNGLTAFGSDGFSVGSANDVNYNSSNLASWNWKANGSGSANTDGTISSTVSASATSGFSIVKYTGNATAGATVGHGLGAVPKMIIVKKTNAAKDWNVYHVGMGATKGMYLNLTNAEQTHTNWNNTTPTSSVFSIGSDDQVNGSGQTYIAYCFAEKTGYSKFGSYTGNGSTDGTFIYTGFKPAFVLTKSTSNAVNWQIQDNKTAPTNLMTNKLFANTNAAQDTGSENTVDFLSNGFKPRGTGSSENINGSGYSYIYMAFAAEPLVANSGANGVPATAR